MAKFLLIVCLISLCFISCESEKSYKYIEVFEKDGLLGGSTTEEEKAETIKAISDSAAYLEAFQRFSISLKVNMDMRETYNSTYSKTPVLFRLYNDDGIEITNTVHFSNKTEREKEIEQKIFSMDNSIKKSADKYKEDKANNTKQTAKIDTIKIKEISKYFRQKKDEFSNDNKVWYEPKSAPQYTNRNGIYCYFQTENGVPNNLRFRFQYYSDDWLFFSKIQFSIDGKAYDYIPSDTDTDSGDGGKIWEWFDEPVTKSDQELIYALANAKSAKMKIIGSKYFDIKIITPEQIKAIKQSVTLFEALGGKF